MKKHHIQHIYNGVTGFNWTFANNKIKGGWIPHNTRLIGTSEYNRTVVNVMCLHLWKKANWPVGICKYQIGVVTWAAVPWCNELCVTGVWLMTWVTPPPKKYPLTMVGSKHQWSISEPQKNTVKLSIQSVLDLLVCAHWVKQWEWFPDVSFAAAVQLNAEKKQEAQNSWQPSPDLRQVLKVSLWILVILRLFSSNL